MSRNKPNAVLALIAAAITRAQLKKMGAYHPGNAQIRNPDAGGTRKPDRPTKR